MSLPPLKPTKVEQQYIIDNHQHLTIKDMAKALGRGHTLVGRWMKELGLGHKKPVASGPKPKAGVLHWDKGRHLQDVWR